MIVVPIIVVVVLVLIAVTFIIRCYQSKRKMALNINENMQRVAGETEASSYADSQYVVDNDQKSNIFARTSMISKVSQADNVTDNVTYTNAEDSSLANSASKLSSLGNEKEQNLGDNLKANQ